MNSIAAYMMAHLFEEFVQNNLRIHLRMATLNLFGAALEPLFLGSLTLLAYWLMLHWMYQKKIFIRI
jgi:heparan-alpha-glucosaminide N-acetyltransferase